MTASTRRRWTIRLLRVAIIAAVIALLQIITGSGVVSTFLLPAPIQIAASYPTLVVDERLFVRLALTVFEVFSAASLAIVVGSAIGWVLYRRRYAWLAFNGWVTGLNATPLVLLYPLFLVIFGRGILTVIIIGMIGALPLIILKTREAFAEVRPTLLDVGRSFNLGPLRQFWLIHLPAAAPIAASGIRLGLFYAQITVIAAEFLTGIGGLGALIPDLADRFKLPAMYGAIVFVVLTSATFVVIITRVERWLRPA